MAYNTLDDILGEIPGEVLVQLTNDSETNITAAMIQTALSGALVETSDPDAPTEEQVAAATAAAAAATKCLNRASAMVDGYCSNLYDVPFDTASPFLKSVDLDVAIYNLFSRRDNVPENRKDRYKNSEKILIKIGAGDIQLGVTGPTAPQQQGQVVQVTPALENIFTFDRLKNF